MTANSTDLDQLSVNAIRALAMDAVQAANSGHPGTPMAMAPVAYTLWQRFLRFDPELPIWANRDRFVLSAGHASTLLFALLQVVRMRTEILRRRAETLSGGETFMASLCLALQLSDEVLKTSGALQMDSLFIDEGFGTLDSESLAEVTDAMEALRQDGARLIGVISHRPELTERLPGCIKVTKGAGESSWQLERVG